MKISAIIPAGGSGNRYSKEKNKLLELLSGKEVLITTIEAILTSDYIDNIIIPSYEGIIPFLNKALQTFPHKDKIQIINGGDTRQASVYNALEFLNKTTKPDYIVIHDGARPLITNDIINSVIKKAIETDAAIVAVPVKDTIKRANSENLVIETPNREELWQIQTPQVFNFDKLIKAHEKYKQENFTDDAALMEKEGYNVFLVKGSYSNIKITTPEDIIIAEALLAIQ
ncbi:MAG: 2-C-methyl-D-erythritol 4-phosphate cytidylyltransferase [bacterium]